MKTIIFGIALLLLAIAVWAYLEPTGPPPAPAHLNITALGKDREVIGRVTLEPDGRQTLECSMDGAHWWTARPGGVCLAADNPDRRR